MHMVTIETFELEQTLAMLAGDILPLAALQVHNCLGMYYLLRDSCPKAVESVAIASHLVRRHNLRFVTPTTDVWDPMLEVSRESEEIACALSHLLYMNMVASVLLGIPSELGTEYEQEFQSIPVCPHALPEVVARS